MQARSRSERSCQLNSWLGWNVSKSMSRRVRVKPDLMKQINLICPVQSYSEKFFASPQTQIKSIFRHPVPKEGRFAIVTDVGCGMRWTLWRGKTNARKRTAKSCGPDAPTLASSWRREVSAGDGDKKARSPGRARRKPLKPLRGECRANRCDRGDYARVLFYFRTRGCGRYPNARHSLRPLLGKGLRKTRADRAARMRKCV